MMSWYFTFAHLFVSLPCPSKIRPKGITIPWHIIIWDKSVQRFPNNVNIQWPSVDTKFFKLNIGKMTMINSRHFLPPSCDVVSKSHLVRGWNCVRVPAHIQVQSMEFVWMAEVVDDTHERSAASLGNPVVEYHNVFIIIFQESSSPARWL